jgi:hypothetical protein
MLTVSILNICRSLLLLSEAICRQGLVVTLIGLSQSRIQGPVYVRCTSVVLSENSLEMQDIFI